MRHEASILHLDLDAFFAAVEQRVLWGSPRRRALLRFQACEVECATPLRGVSSTELALAAHGFAAGVHRSFLYRPSHQDLLAAVKRAQATPPAVRAGGRVSDAGLRAENANLRSQNQRLTERLRVLERRLGEALGTAIHTQAGLGSGETAEPVQRRLQQAEEQVRTLRRELEEREDELRAARAANRELLTALNVGR